MRPTSCLCLFAIGSFVVTYSSSDAHTYDPEGWSAASKYLREALDTSVNPCDDFYGFVCNKWNETLGTDKVQVEFLRAQQDVSNRLTKALRDVNLENPKVIGFKRSLKSFYVKCMAKPYADDEALIRDIYNNLDKLFMPTIIVKVNGTEFLPWQLDDGATFWNFIGKLQKEQNVKFLIAATLETADVNCTTKPLLRFSYPRWRIDQAALNITFQKIIGEYHNVTISPEDLNDTYREIFAFEEELSNLYKHSSEAGRQMKVSQLAVAVPHVDWTAYLDGLLPDDVKSQWLTTDPEVVLDDEQFFQKMPSVMKKFDQKTVYNVGYALVIQRLYELFTLASFDTYDARDYFGGQKQQENVCLDLALRYFSSAAARLVFDSYQVSITDWKVDVQLLAESIFSAFRYMVTSLDWVDSEDKWLLIEKINVIKFNCDIPEWLIDDEQVEARTPEYNFSLSLVANDILTQKKLFRGQLTPLLTGSLQQMPPNFFLNAYYWKFQIRIMLGMLLPPLYSYSYPLAVKYGTLGFIIGHELLHGFDAVRVHRDKPPHLKRWLKESTLKVFNRKKQCLVQQYSQYCYEEHNACISGQRTINDNIADVEGMKLAFMAYRFASQTMGGEPLLDEMVDFSMDQIFFISAARGWCGNEFNTAILLQEDVHSPPKARIERTLSNFRAFAKTFNCPMGSKYAPIKTCSLWGNFWEPDYNV